MQKLTLKQIRNVKKEVDLRNEVDQAIFATEKTIKETEGKGFDAERDAAQAALDDLKKAQEDNNLDEMKAKLEALNEKLKDLLLNSTNKPQQLNKLKQEQKGAQATGNAGDDVVDGEFTIEK